MSSRRSRSRNNTPGAGSGSRISEDELNDLVSKLHQILPRELRDRCSSDKVSAARVLQETCNYIRSLNREVDGLSERLSDLLENSDTTQAALIRSLLTQ